MKTLLYVVGFVAALWFFALVTNAYAAQRPDLEARLPAAHPVFCSDSTAAWEEETAAWGSILAYTWIAGPHVREIHLSPGTCRALADTDSKGFPDAAETLYHEWVHAQWLWRDEGGTECLALHFYRHALRRFWGFTVAQSDKAYRAAWKTHELLGLLYPSYRGDCAEPDAAP